MKSIGLFPALAVLVVLITALSGCATQEINDQNIEEVMHAFQNGTVQLGSTMATAGNSGWYSDRLMKMYRDHDWIGLSKLVIKANDANDFTWFLLGASAEGLGYKRAAQQYYLNSINAPIHDCEPGQFYLKDLCGEIVLPRDAKVALKRIR